MSHLPLTLTSPTSLALILGIVLFVMSVFMLLRGRGLAVIFRTIPALLLLVIAITLTLGSLDIMSYRQLLKETSVATLHFEQVSTQTYNVMLIDKNNQRHYFQLKGDQWQMDARIIRWHPNLARAGLKPVYRMERLSGRYSDITQELDSKRTVYPIDTSSYGLDAWYWFRQMKWLHQWVDASYGSATYVPMVNGAIYEAKMGYSGLSAHPVNDKSRQAVTAWQ
jgi:hypothetical protein